MILGIDEAGRGCVIGPLVVAGVWGDELSVQKLQDFKNLDSKKYSRQERDFLLINIKNIAVKIIIQEIAPQEIDDGNINDLEVTSITRIINASVPKKVFIDAPVTPRGIPNFIANLKYKLNNEHLDICARNKADSIYPIVGAASIVAKVHRDNIIEDLKKKYGDFGWGYPSEEKTQRFLKDWYVNFQSWPYFVRKKWKTITAIEMPQLTLW